MKKHTQIYLNYFDYGEQDFIPCELHGTRAVDIHHISARGMGGSKEKDHIENLMALCRDCHDKAESEIYIEDLLKGAHHFYILLRKQLEYDGNSYFIHEQVRKYYESTFIQAS